MNAAIAIFCMALVATIWSATIKQAQTEREEVIAGAIRQNSNLAIAFEEHTTRTIKEVEAAVLFITHEYARLGTKLDLAGYINDGYIDGKLFTVVGVVGAGGDLLLSSQPFNPVNLSDREHISVHKQRGGGKLFIGKPVLSRTTNRWSIPMTRRISNVDGGFGGVVVAMVDPEYFTDFYQKTDLGEHGLVNLVGFDGISRARRVGKTANSGLEMSNSDVLQEQAKNGIGSFLSSGGTEGIARYMSYRTCAITAGGGGGNFAARRSCRIHGAQAPGLLGGPAGQRSHRSVRRVADEGIGTPKAGDRRAHRQ